jgi:UDP-N-acetyl-D-mannosaminuronic acid transferase (WecB/TagA/CpsF family)
VLARCSTEPFTERLFRAAALINADGQPLVTVSRLKSRTPLPERVATTDLFDMVARKAAAAGLTFYVFGADEEENAAAVANIRKVYRTCGSSGVPTATCLATRCAPRSTKSTPLAGLSLGRAWRSLRAGLCR